MGSGIKGRGGTQKQVSKIRLDRWRKHTRGIRMVPPPGRGQPKQASSGSRPHMFLVFNVLDLTAAPNGITLIL